MLTTDVPIKQYVLHLYAIAPAEGKFVIAYLDERRVLIQPERAEQVKLEI